MLSIAKSTMRYKQSLPDSKKAAHILRLGKLYYDNVLAIKRRDPSVGISRGYVPARNSYNVCVTAGSLEEVHQKKAR
jgi:hypothetical protein